MGSSVYIVAEEGDGLIMQHGLILRTTVVARNDRPGNVRLPRGMRVSLHSRQ